MYQHQKNMSWMTRVLFVGLLWIYPVCSSEYCKKEEAKVIFTQGTAHFVVVDNFRGVISAGNYWKDSFVDHCEKGVGNQNLIQREPDCMVFLQRTEIKQRSWSDRWPEILKTDGSYLLIISKWHIKRKLHLHVLEGKQCCPVSPGPTDSKCVFKQLDLNVTGSCLNRCLDTETICDESSYDENKCRNLDEWTKNGYIINITATNSNCLNCNNPVKQPELEVQLNVTFELKKGEKLDATEAVKVMNQMADLATSINTSSAALTVGEGISGILVKQTDPVDIDNVFFAYTSLSESMTLIDNSETMATWSRSISVSREAFEKALSSNVSVPFAVALRFLNLASDEKNSTVLDNEVLAVEMGATITNLTDKMRINYLKVKYEGIPSCQSWNGDGSRPNWTDDGCLTISNGDNITCECSHLTFFAVLLTPLNETISSSDLNNLTMITQVGCGISIFFLSIVLFMHFLLRKTQASVTTKILIHLVSAMFLLNFSFLINNFVAKLKSSVGCKIMAALMHYFMLATFTWFAMQAFHICLQVYTGGRIVIRHYTLKVSITSWVLPSVVVIVLLIIGKYGEQVISASDTEDNVVMCWMTDSDVHYIVNIGYYALVFLFTFTTFIIILSWLFCLKRARTGAAKGSASVSGKSIVVILGLCCMLGITWGFAFFAYGAFRIPAYYIFTVLNSFQGFFLFIFYYTSHSGELISGHNISTSTLQTSLSSLKNPYTDPPDEEKKTSGD